MRSTTKRKLLRTVATCLLALQVNLLWIAGLHHHDEWMGLLGQAQSVQQGGSHTLPAEEAALFCPICQIVRQSAARPATVSSAAALRASISRLLVLTSSSVHPHFPVVSYGRAPPLA
ncbi:MAG: hypothetical protein ACREDR_45030 [Blastocatellia bacterium]